MFPINSAYLWTSGPQQAVMDVRLREDANIYMPAFKDRLRKRLSVALPEVEFSFEPGDIVSQIMNIGSTTPIAVNVRGHDLVQDRIFAQKVMDEMAKIPYLRDLQWGQPQEYPTCDIKINRELAGQLGITPFQIGHSLTPAFFSSRFILLSFWKDRNSGVCYQVQVQVPQDQIKSKADIEQFPVMGNANMQHPLISDVAKVEYGVTNGEYDRYNMMRMVSVTANITGKDMGNVGTMVQEAIARAGTPPHGVFVDIKGQLPILRSTFDHLFMGLGLAVVVIFLILSAYFQAPKLVLVVLGTTPGILTGVLLSLYLSQTTLNVESFMGAIMSIGVGISNAILLVVFAEKNRVEGMSPEEAGIHAAQSRMRPVLMTSIAMVAGMVPMAISSGQSASLGRAVIGGLSFSTLSALTVLPLIFSVIQAKAALKAPSLHPEDRGE
jgi:multidrug efflux pump subunit AcrB